MSDAEIFLLTWAVLATILAGFFHSVARKTIRLLAGSMHLVSDIADGEVDIAKDRNGNLVLKRKEDEETK